MAKGTIKPGDIIITLLVAAAIAAITIAVYRAEVRPSLVRIKTESGLNLYPLDQARTLQVEGPLGTTVIRIAGGSVRVLSSPCRDKLCILKGTLHHSGDWTACMPNRVFISIEGRDKDKEALDEFSY